jgi:hypothetical protein
MQGFLFARPVPADAFARMLGAGLVMPPGLRIDADAFRTTMSPPRLAHGFDHHAVVVL